MKKRFLLMATLCSLGAPALAQSGKVGIGTTTPAQKLHVNGKIRVDSVSTTVANPIFIIAANVKASADTVWHQPLGWKADNTLAILPGQLQTAVNCNQNSSGTLLTIPSVLWGTGATANYFFAVKIEGFYSDACASSPGELLTIFCTASKMRVTLSGEIIGTLTNPSTGIYVWTLPGNGCGYSRSFTWDANTRTLSYNGNGGGSTTVTGTATLYGNTYP